MKSFVRIIVINIGVGFGLVGFLLLLPPSFSFVGSQLGASTDSKDPRATLEIYKNFSWAPEHFKEFRSLKTSYHDYITWRRVDFAGQTITVNDGLRRTLSPEPNHTQSKEFWFFGGSTTWGTGVTDEYTYPSMFAKRYGHRSINYGETSYIGRQSLAYLVNLLGDHSASLNLQNTHVVFYDGVNDVLHRCRRNSSTLGSRREQQVKAAVESASQLDQMSFTKTFAQLRTFLHYDQADHPAVENGGESDEFNFVCAEDPGRALEIATTLVQVWKIASEIVANRGGKFTAILQPVTYLGSPSISYLDLSSREHNILALQYEAVYPLIRKLAQESGLHFVDLTKVYDNCKDCYVDFCHASPQGHAKLVEALAPHLLAQ